MKHSLVLTGIKTRTAKEFLSLEPEKNSNYLNIIEDDGCLELFKDLADIAVLQENVSKDITCIAICLWVRTKSFELYLPKSLKNQIFELRSEIRKVEKPYLKMLIEIDGPLSSNVSVQKIESGETTKYYFNPYSSNYAKNPF